MNPNSQPAAAEQINDQNPAAGEPVAEPGTPAAADSKNWPRRAERERSQAEDPPAPRARLLDRIGADVIAAVSEWRSLSERPLSWREHLAYARSGEWTVQGRGLLRDLMALYDWAIAIPVLTVTSLLLVAVRRPGRFFSLLAIFLIATTALNAIPVVELLVPDWATITYWPPFSWIF